MFGLLQTIANGLENVVYTVNDAAAQVNCTAKNYIVEKQYEKKHKQYQKNIEKAQVEDLKKRNDIIDMMIEALSNDNVEFVRNILNNNMNEFKVAVANASPEQIDDLNKVIDRLDLLAGIILSVRQNAAQAIGEGSPLFYPAQDRGLAQLASEKGTVSGKDIVERLQNPQQANPAGINGTPIMQQA